MKDSELSQFYKPYESTIAFHKLLLKLNLINKKTKSIIDIGTGIGSNLHFLSSKNKNIKFLGIDHEAKRIKIGQRLNKNKNSILKKRDILKSVKSLQNKFDGLICIHTLCCFKELRTVLTNFCKIRPKWIY